MCARGGGRVVAYMHSCLYSFFPEHVRQVSSIKHRLRELNESAIHTFSFAVLLWCIRYSAMVYDPVVLEQFDELVRLIFSATIQLEDFNLQLELYFDKGLELLEDSD